MRGEKKFSILADHLGTPTHLFSEQGDTIWEGSLDSYGKLRIDKGEIGSCPFRYQGQYEDLETGLYYNRFRYYDHEEGRYISQDPIGLISGEPNLYAYVQDPNGWVDVFGLEGITSTVGDLRSARLKDAHHVIQDAAVRDLPGYDTNKARGVQLEGPSTQKGTPHYEATLSQRSAGGGTYGAERRIGYKALRKAGLSRSDARAAIFESDKYFESIGVTKDTKTRKVGNRRCS
ncbi:RHS repeat-associated core domain-containing protein [Flavobacterium ardleyense]|uniref:RHS repeat-associated core domain-containing protein n=1 Tax=Flavobacterium ardleyense TaxID=2038737 RepID=A0ABW5Z8R4_9FLAO